MSLAPIRKEFYNDPKAPVFEREIGTPVFFYYIGYDENTNKALYKVSSQKKKDILEYALKSKKKVWNRYCCVEILPPYIADKYKELVVERL